jgi:hypothetical protein
MKCRPVAVSFVTLAPKILPYFKLPLSARPPATTPFVLCSLFCPLKTVKFASEISYPFLVAMVGMPKKEAWTASLATLIS